MGNHAQVAADLIKKWHGSKVSCHVDMDDAMTNNFEIFVQGKNQTYLVHSRMKKNHKLFKEESPEHMELLKQAILDIILGKEPVLPESKKKEDKQIKAQIEDGVKTATAEKQQKSEETKQKMKALANERTASKEPEPMSTAAAQDKAKTNVGKAQPRTRRLSSDATDRKKVAKEQQSSVGEKSKKPAAKTKAKTKAKAKATTQPQVVSGPEVKPEAQLDSTTASTATIDRLSEAKAVAPIESDRVDSPVSTTASEDSLEGKAEALEKSEDVEVGEASPAATEEVHSPASSTEGIDAVIVGARVEKQEEPVVEQEIPRPKAPVQSVVEVGFFGFFCCRGSRIDDRCANDDGDHPALLVVEQEHCFSK